MSHNYSHLSPRNQAIAAFFELGTVRKAADHLERAPSTVREHLKKAGIDIRAEEENYVSGDTNDKPVSDGVISMDEPMRLDLPPKGQVKRYILTSAQNNTWVHSEFVQNIMAFAEEFDAEIFISRGKYNLSAYRNKNGSEKPGASNDSATDNEDWFDPHIRNFIMDDAVELAPGLIWCGEQQITVTSVNPLSGFDDYRGCNSLIFPAPKIAMRTVPTAKYQDPKLMYTTGTVTTRNYSKTKTGHKASWNHVYGFLLVEVDSDGDWFARQVSACDEDGSFQDLNIRVKKGRIYHDGEIEVLTPGDIHVDQLEPVIRKAFNELIDDLRPNEIHLHDCLDFRSRSHHSLKNHHSMFDKYVNGIESVEDELQRLVDFFNEIDRDWMKMVVVYSNHDDHLRRWLVDAPAIYARDPVNAITFLKLQLAVYEAKARKDNNFHLLEYACSVLGIPDGMHFLRNGEEYIKFNIECDLHGDKGPNGSRGSMNNLSKSGNKVNIGHSHTAGIVGGAYQAGVMANLDMGYNEGPSSWSRSLIVTYENGKRSIITMRGTKWRAR